ncbi:hypothetical protein CLV47_11417 [Antricoccus suffuscus]|uniref:Calcineurin-like phosphoesterase domain-containing protein n=1 Tax=Antricoccus suffuscus TaxID=1629062 RepID=A0A2T0ZWJ5_9ACTN|nr:metallophosphoesterase [Antricoccus suffuscus]PRZ40720.1 hypothetical protein CLV47_11417 [Antricoccus suffuscus]
MTRGRLLIFIGVLFIVSAILHVMPLWIVVLAPIWSTPVKVAGIVILCVGALAMPILMIFGHGQKRDLPALIGDVWLGAVWQFFVWSVICEFVGFIAWAFGADHGARERYVALACVVIVAGLLAGGAITALGRVGIRHVTIRLDRLPQEFDGRTIAHITDTHLSLALGERWMTRIVQQVNSLSPDIVCHTGDLADGDVARRTDAVSALGEIRAPLGRFYITGNHEYLSDAAYWVAHMRKLGWTVLQNAHAMVRIGEANLAMVGINDLTAPGNDAASDRPDIDKAVQGIPAGTRTVLLAHQPKQVRDAVHQELDLQLSGHTHGGQIWPFHYLVRAEQGALSGLSRPGPSTQLYISRGTGFWGPPFRIGAPPEIALITLRRA